MCIDSILALIQGMMEYFETYRNEGFSNCLNIAKGIANDMALHASFQVKCHALRKKFLMKVIFKRIAFQVCF
jgi:hypothetical protein